ncbi:MAG: AAA family ATPase [Defluviitaleaceae bacterium]|nr:AAA family ATPase [Defluviitaleaceae bacterium]
MLEGSIENIIFHNVENGYTVFSLRVNNDDEEEIICTGFFSNPLEGESIRAEGNFVENPRYGRQFSVEKSERVKPSTLAGIEKYLASGVIKGIGAKTAKIIVARFKENTFDVIENDPQKLSSLRGISLKKALQMSESFHAQHDQRHAALFLQEHGITTAAAMKIYKRYKEETIETVKKNPYRLADEIDGIGFKTADAIAHRLGVSRDSPERISAGVRFCLWEATNEGHTFMPTNALIRQSSELLFCPPLLIENELARMQMERQIIREKIDGEDEPLVFVSAMYYAEIKVARKLFELNSFSLNNAGALPPNPHALFESHTFASQMRSQEMRAKTLTLEEEKKFANEEQKNFSNEEQKISPSEKYFSNGCEVKIFSANENFSNVKSFEGVRGNFSKSSPEELSSQKVSPEKNEKITLSDGQKTAVDLAQSRGVLILTGGPGTGKTTVINTIIGILEQRELTVTLAAPTGRAAKRMSEATGREAKTIHRLLEVAFISEDSRRQVFNRNEENPLETDVLIVDESSMIDILLMRNLLDAVADGTRLILVGDMDQLPSVGAGNVLKDLINSNCLPVARLTEIFRQAAESAIITNAHRINKGAYPALNDKEKDFFFIERQTPEEITRTILNLISTRLPAYKNFNSLHDIQVLTPMRKSTLGVSFLNNILQAQLNPPSSQKREREYGAIIFREGDKIMQIRNNYDAAWEIFNEKNQRTDFGEGVFNGDMGTILTISDDAMCVLFDDNRRVNYNFSQLDELELAYAVTVHKSQGSEYRAVIIPVFNGPPMLLTRNLLYTAVTRAKELAVLVGLPETMRRMIDNNRVTNRYTALARRLKILYDA